MKKLTALFIIIGLLLAACGNGEQPLSEESIITKTQSITPAPATTTPAPATITEPAATTPEPAATAEIIEISEPEPLEPVPFYPAENPNERGNTTGNITNGGDAALYDGWIYYDMSWAAVDYIPAPYLNKIRADNTGNTDNTDRVILDSTNTEYAYNYINVVGDWIYYSANGIRGDNAINTGIYRIRTDGTEKAKLSHDRANYLNVIGDRIYYVFDADIYNGGNIYSIRTDGTERTKINEDASRFINVVGDWIYYANHDDNGSIYKIRIDGTEKIKLSDDTVNRIIVDGEWIYYAVGEFWGGELCKIRTDGTDRMELNLGYIYGYNIAGDWIYYSVQDENDADNSSLRKIRTDGTGEELLMDDIFSSFSISSINIAGNWIYYSHTNGWGILSKVRTDGTDNKTVDEDLLIISEREEN